MTAGRNDPCPCGSGRKYKRCCLPEDRAREANAVPAASRSPGSGPSLSDEVVEAARGAAVWEADLFAMPVRFDREPHARPSMCVVTARGFVVHQELIQHPVNEVDEVALILEDGILEAEERLGELPLVVEVRHPEVADAVWNRVADRGIRIESAERLPAIEKAGRALLRDVAGVDVWPPLAAPETWRAWGHPLAGVARLFREAAAFYRAQPWRVLPADEALSVFLPDGQEWTAAVLGAGGEEFGLALYEDPEDLFDLLFDPIEPTDTSWDLRGACFSLLFEDADEIPRAMRKEIARAGWKVADPSAYPVLMAMNTPAGGVHPRAFEDLTRSLGSLARLATAVASGAVSLEAEEEWLDPETEILVAWEPAEPSPWRPPERLAPGGPGGPGADPDALLEPWDPRSLEAEHEPVLDAFARYLDEEKGFSEATVTKHTENAWLFLRFLSHHQGVPLRGLHEMHLRLFLFDWCIRTVRGPKTYRSALPVSLKRLVAFLEEEGGLTFPWARSVLAERDAFEARHESFPGGLFWSPRVSRWIGSVWDDLDRRVMVPDPGLGGEGETWGAEMGPEEADLQDELQRRWLLWRDELVRDGQDRPEELRAGLIARQREWQESPHPRLDGRTPVQVVRAERADRGDR